MLNVAARVSLVCDPEVDVVSPVLHPPVGEEPLAVGRVRPARGAVTWFFHRAAATRPGTA